MSRGRSTAVPLAVVVAALIVYASLYPLTGWGHPAGWAAWREITLPWNARWTAADAWLNVLGYVPFGLLATLALRRGAGWSTGLAALGGLALAALLSLAMESLQTFLPQRVPSSVDLAWNTAGAAVGCVAAVLAQSLRWLDRGALVHDRWFEPQTGFGATLLVLWPAALLVPTPVALGIGPSLDRLRAAMFEWLRGPELDATVAAPAATAIERWIGVQGAVQGPPAQVEMAIAALGLLAPSLVAFSIARSPWRRVLLAFGAAAMAVGMLTLSTALNFGPDHALAWRTPASTWGITAGLAIACALAVLPTRGAALAGLPVLATLLLLVATAPADPYFAQSLQAWEQGRFVRFHGAAQWIGWAWPLMAFGYLLLRLSRRSPAPAAARSPRRPGASPRAP